MTFGKPIYKNVSAVICSYLFIGLMFRFHINSMTKLCKMVHTIVGSYSSAIAPSALVGSCFFVGSRYSFSVGSPIFLMSHHNTCPSEEAEKHSVPVFD